MVEQFKKLMENVFPQEKTQNIPIIVEAEVGENWGEMKRVETGSKK